MESVPVTPSTRPPGFWLFVQLGAGVLVGMIALAWAMRGLDLHVVLDSLTQAHYVWVFLSVVCVVGVALTKAARWNTLYTVSDSASSFWDVFGVLVITQMINVLIPIRISEVARLALMKQSGQPAAITLSTIVIEKALDLVAVGLIAVSLVVLAVAPTWLQQWSTSVLLVGLTIVVGLVAVWMLRGWMELVVARVLAVGGWLPHGWQQKLLRVTHTMLQGLHALTDLRSLLRVLLWTTMVWVLSTLAILALFAAFDLHVPAAAVVIMMLAIGFSGVIPAPPGMVGVMQGIAVVVLGEYGVSQPVAMGFGIVLNVVTVGPLIILGSLALWQRTVYSVHAIRGRTWRDFWTRS